MIFYLHIPKTGGQTLASRLASAFPLNRTRINKDEFNSSDVERIRKMTESFDFVEGHLRGDVLSKLPELEVMCTVRNPIDQILSNYRHIQREPDNFLYRPANELPFTRFFEDYTAEFFNFQSAYLISALIGSGAQQALRPHRWVLSRLFEAIDRIKWLVPTEAIDDFTMMWSADVGRAVPYHGASRNVAMPKGTDKEIRAYLRDREDLYDVDMCLWQEANARQREYREAIISRSIESDNSARAFAEGNTGILAHVGLASTGTTYRWRS